MNTTPRQFCMVSFEESEPLCIVVTLLLAVTPTLKLSGKIRCAIKHAFIYIDFSKKYFLLFKRKKFSNYAKMYFFFKFIEKM